MLGEFELHALLQAGAHEIALVASSREVDPLTEVGI
jgi:hypothetical protein